MPTADYSAKVERVPEVVNESDEVHLNNAALLHDYRRDKELNGMSAATQQRNLSYLKKLAEQAGDERFVDMDADDVKDLVAWIHDRDLADDTVDIYKKANRSFWRWLKDAPGNETPDEVAWIELTNSGGNSDTLPESVACGKQKERLRAQTPRSGPGQFNLEYAPFGLVVGDPNRSVEHIDQRIHQVQSDP
jgi:hypothetical protein